MARPGMVPHRVRRRAGSIISKSLKRKIAATTTEKIV
jgi:hypothetical protein